MGHISDRADRFVDKLLARLNPVEIRHPAEVEMAKEVLKTPLRSRLRQRRQQHSKGGK